MARYRAFCFTDNNPSLTKEGVLNILCSMKNNIRYCVIGDEIATTGTKHLQGYIAFEKSVTVLTVKKFLPKAHIERAFAGDIINKAYCTKEGSFVEYGHPREGKNNKCTDVLSALYNDKENEVIDDISYVRYNEYFNSAVRHMKNIDRCKAKQAIMKESPLRDWQKQVFLLLKLQSEREILWVYDSVGGLGKTWFSRYMKYVFGAVVFNGVTKANDLVYLLPEEFNCVIFDIKRKSSNQIAYSTMEHLKDGSIMTGKYKGLIRDFDVPSVCVFANVMPDGDAFSIDRIKVIDLSEELNYEIPNMDVYLNGVENIYKKHIFNK